MAHIDDDALMAALQADIAEFTEARSALLSAHPQDTRDAPPTVPLLAPYGTIARAAIAAGKDHREALASMNQDERYAYRAKLYEQRTDALGQLMTRSRLAAVRERVAILAGNIAARLEEMQELLEVADGSQNADTRGIVDLLLAFEMNADAAVSKLAQSLGLKPADAA